MLFEVNCHNLYMAPAALLQDRAGAGPIDLTSSRFLELIVHMLLYICKCKFGKCILFHCVSLCVGLQTRD